MDRYPSANPLYRVGEPNIEIKAANYILHWKEDQKENTVTVWLSQINGKVMQAFRNEVMDSPQILFRKTSPLTPVEGSWAWRENDFWWEDSDYYLTMPKQTITLPVPEKVFVTLHNKSEHESTTDYYYWIEYNDQGTWKVITFITNDNTGFAFLDVGLFLNPDSRQAFTIPLHPDLYDYGPGEYRIRKRFYIEGRFRKEGASRIWENYHVVIPFWIK
ncbi:MAG: hypothetical protein LUE93_15550 [Bacteroides sp.]|nr:hypothetical protein [Bacteroides sp.]